MKKIAALLLSLLLIGAACTAAADTVVTAKPGDELTMEISIESASGNSARIGIQTNGAPVTFVKAVGGSANDTVPPRGFGGSFAVVNLSGADISADGTSLSGGNCTVDALVDGVVGKLTFLVNDDAAPGVYTLEPYKKSGSVTVKGIFTFKVEEKQTSDRVPGDVNGDGKINSRDALSIIKYASGQDLNINLNNADVNADGKVNSRDALVIIKYASGQDVELK